MISMDDLKILCIRILNIDKKMNIMKTPEKKTLETINSELLILKKDLSNKEAEYGSIIKKKLIYEELILSFESYLKYAKILNMSIGEKNIALKNLLKEIKNVNDDISNISDKATLEFIKDIQKQYIELGRYINDITANNSLGKDIDNLYEEISKIRNKFIGEKYDVEFQAILDKIKEKETDIEDMKIDLDFQERELCMVVTKKAFGRILKDCHRKILINIVFVFVDVWLILCSLNSNWMNKSFSKTSGWNIFNYFDFSSQNDSTITANVFFILLIFSLLILMVVFINNIVSRYFVAITQSTITRNELESYILTIPEIRPEIINNKIHIASLDINNRLSRSMISSLLGLED
jgi:hypothetical protein